MGAPCDIAAAYARQSSFGGEPGVSEPHATSVHTVLDCQQADYREHNHHYPYTAARDMLADPQHNLHFSLSGNMSDCSETLRADSVSGMELQESYMFLDDDLVAGEAMIEPPQHDTETSSDTVPVPPSSFKPEQVGSFCGPSDCTKSQQLHAIFMGNSGTSACSCLCLVVKYLKFSILDQKSVSAVAQQTPGGTVAAKSAEG